MKFKWDRNYIYRGVTAFCVIACSIVFYLLLNRWGEVSNVLRKLTGVLSPVIIGIAVAYLLAPVMNFLERNLFSKPAAKIFKKNKKRAAILSRVLSMTSALIILFVLTAGLVLMVIPELIISIERLISNTDRYISVAQEWINGLATENPELEHTIEGLLGNTFISIRTWLSDTVISKVDVLLINITSGVYSVLKAVFDFAVGIIISIYLLYSKEGFSARSKKLLYSLFKTKTVNSMLDSFRLTNKMFSGFLVGKILASIIVGVVCAVFMLIFGMPYVALISALVAVTNIIPFIGPFIGGVPSAFLLLLENPTQCFIFVIFIIVLQFFEGNVLSPKIMGSNTGLTGFWIIFAILLGGMFGFLGMVVAVPLFAVFYHAISEQIKRRLSKRDLPTETEDFKSISFLSKQSDTQDNNP